MNSYKQSVNYSAHWLMDKCYHGHKSFCIRLSRNAGQKSTVMPTAFSFSYQCTFMLKSVTVLIVIGGSRFIKGKTNY